MAVRRHGCPMMMVVAVMAEALHLYPRYGKSPFGVNCISYWWPLLSLLPAYDEAENGCVPARNRFAAAPIAILAVIIAPCWVAYWATSVAAAPQWNLTPAAPQASAKTKSAPS